MLVVGALLGSVLAGCLGPKSTPGSPSGTPSTSPSNGPTPPPAFRLENCTGVVGIFEAPYTTTKDVVPGGLAPVGLTPVTVGILFEASQCERIVSPHRVYPDAGVLQILVDVIPSDKSWTEPNVINRYALDMLTTNPELAAEFRETGVANQAAEFQSSVVSSGLGPTVRSWKYTSPNMTVEVEYEWQGSPAGGFHDKFHHWFGSRPLHRVEQDQNLRYDQGVWGGVLRIRGSSQSTQAFGACCEAWFGQGVAVDNEVWTVTPRDYP